MQRNLVWKNSQAIQKTFVHCIHIIQLWSDVHVRMCHIWGTSTQKRICRIVERERGRICCWNVIFHHCRTGTNKKVNKNTARCEGARDKYGERRVGVVRVDEVGMLNINQLTAGSRKERGYFQEAGHHWSPQCLDNIHVERKREQYRRGRRDGGRRGNAARERYVQRCRLPKEVSPPLERKSHNAISDGKNVFFSDERKIKRAQPNVKDDKWRSARKHQILWMCMSKDATNRTCLFALALTKTYNDKSYTKRTAKRYVDLKGTCCHNFSSINKLLKFSMNFLEMKTNKKNNKKMELELSR